MPFDPTKRTIAYVDGFNLYHLALQETDYRWSNPKLLIENVLGHPHCLHSLNFYTARVSSKIDPEAPKKQQIYLNALSTIGGVNVTFGNFQVRDKWRRITESTEKLFKPKAVVVRVVNPEEKGSDVNLGSHLIRDGFTQAYEQAVVCTNDTDLFEPIRIVTKELGLPVILVTPSNNIARPVPTAKKLENAVGGKGNVFHMRDGHIKAALMPNPVTASNGKQHHMPPSWSNGAQKGS